MNYSVWGGFDFGYTLRIIGFIIALAVEIFCIYPGFSIIGYRTKRVVGFELIKCKDKKNKLLKYPLTVYKQNYVNRINTGRRFVDI